MNKLNSFYLSQALHKSIYDEYNDCIGRLVDIYVTAGDGYPKAIGYKVKKVEKFIIMNSEVFKFMRTMGK